MTAGEDQNGSLLRDREEWAPECPTGLAELLQQGDSPTRLSVSCSSCEIPGPLGTAHVAYYSLKLADRLYLTLVSRGRKHRVEVAISFVSPPAGLEPAVTAPTRTTANPPERGGSREEDHDEEDHEPLQADGQERGSGSGGGGGGGGGRPCSLVEWLRAWGDDVTVGGVRWIATDGRPRLVAECGLLVAVRSSGRRVEYLEVSVRDAAQYFSEVTALTPGSVEVAQAQSDTGLQLSTAD